MPGLTVVADLLHGIAGAAKVAATSIDEATESAKRYGVAAAEAHSRDSSSAVAKAGTADDPVGLKPVIASIQSKTGRS